MSNLMDPDACLPPRKRLLNEAKTSNASPDIDGQLLFPSGELGARLRNAVKSSSSSLEEIIEAANSVASAAAEAARAAREVAEEKATIAAKARAEAKSALEFLISLPQPAAKRRGRPPKVKLKNKNIPIKLLYKTEGRRQSGYTMNTDLAQSSRSSINSILKFSSNAKKPRSSTSCARRFSYSKLSPFVSSDAAQSPEKCSLAGDEKSSGVSLKPDDPEESCSNSLREDESVLNSNSKPGRKKRKLNEIKCCDDEDDKEQHDAHYPGDSEVNEEPMPDGAQGGEPLTGTKSVAKGPSCAKITSVWKCKKLKSAHCFSDSNTMHPARTAPAESSAVLKAS